MKHLGAVVLFSAFSLLGQQYDAPHHFLGTALPLTTPTTAYPEQAARQHLRSVAQELSLSPEDLASVYLAKQYGTAHNGVTHLIFRQRFAGVGVQNAEWVVNLDRNGRVLNAGGNLYPAPHSQTLPTRDRAARAAQSAVAAVNPSLKGAFAAVESSQPPRRPQLIRFAHGPLARDVEGEPTWYAHRGTLRPAWSFFVADTDQVHRYAVTVDDQSQTILHQHALTFFQQAATTTYPSPAPHGMVFDQDSPQPNPTPGIQLTAPPPVVPRVMKDFTGDPTASPFGWTDGTATSGNNVVAGENLAGTSFIMPVPVAGVNGEFNFPLQIGPGFFPLNFPQAAVTNLFYWMNLAHDLHYQYGFDEPSGNFQLNNIGRGGVDGDPVFAYAHFGAVAAGSGEFENSFFSLEGNDDDGVQAEISMFISGGSGALNDVFTDGSYDSMVMVHEYTHGVSSRLARQVYTTFQGASMGEAWSDFYGIEYTTPDGAPPDGIYPSAQYFNQSWGTGIRTRPYSTDMNVDPLTYANLGHVRSFPEVHADGEIWVAALWDVRANLIAQFGEAEGRKRVRQLVMDGMKLAVPAASMIDMRDAILLADRVDYNGASQQQLWAGFAKRGMGALAFSDGANTVHVMSSFDMPSNTGQLKFYDDPIVLGEPLRVVLEDLNYSQPTVRIQLTSSSGDAENLILHQRGSVYEGQIATVQTAATPSNARLELLSQDQITAQYMDWDIGDGTSNQVQATIHTMMPYALFASVNSFSFENERRVTVPQGSYAIQQLPFAFPFYDKTYSSVYVFSNGLIAFELPATPGACADSVNLRNYHAVAPLWTASSATTVTGSAQSGEGVYISIGTNSITFRWAGQYTALAQSPSPTNFAATLFADGRVQFNYGGGNQTTEQAASFSECGPSVVGLGNGHDVYAFSIGFSSLTNAPTLRFDPPFQNVSVPDATIAAPQDGDHVQDILMVNGTTSDSAEPVISLDIFVDGRSAAHLAPGSTNTRWSTVLNLSGLGIVSGTHTLAVKVTNSRGGTNIVPATPVSFTVDPGAAFAPVVTIESPTDGATIKGPLMVSGYAYDTALTIQGVDTLIDGFTYGPTTYGAPRSDICNALSPAPINCPAIGFSATILTVESAPPIPDGPHTLQVRVRDQTGRLTLYPATPLNVTVQNGQAAPVIGVLESPANNATLSGTVTLSGYMYSAGQRIIAGVVIVDGSTIGTVTLGVPRPDVCPSLPAADACPNIGFTFNLDTTRFQNGPHTIGIEGVNTRGDYAIFPNLTATGMNIFVKN
ncbi:MAG TPA: M36 family metallopeptidase [Bryobacteraceae bacterium]|nr:M36 family metallopeptidase [Bryobacteraceae bacterium]